MDNRDDKDLENKKGKYPAPFSLRLSKEERKELAKLADGLPWGAYIKGVIFEQKRKLRVRGAHPIKDHKLLAKLLGALGKSRIANNINQLAKAANSGSLPVNEDVLQGLNDAVSAIRWVRETIIIGMGLKPQGGDGLTGSGEGEDDPQG